jgi:hypothetical protein
MDGDEYSATGGLKLIGHGTVFFSYNQSKQIKVVSSLRAFVKNFTFGIVSFVETSKLLT